MTMITNGGTCPLQCHTLNLLKSFDKGTSNPWASFTNDGYSLATDDRPAGLCLVA